MCPSPSQVLRLCSAVLPPALLLAGLLHAGAAQSQPVPDGAALRTSPRLREDIPATLRPQLPTFVSGERISGQPDLQTEVEGRAEMRRGDTVLRADRIEYRHPQDQVRATGQVRINKAGNIYEGSHLELKVDDFVGFFLQPRYQFLRNDAYGEAERADFVGDQRVVVRNATYTTCRRRPGPGWMPDWVMRAASLSLDNQEEIGHASGAVLDFMGLPILPLPPLSFPLSDKRKSGLLPPTIGLDNVSGLELTLPYYWNIAPNRDATLFPTLMSKRGVDLGGEFRYLEQDYRGTLRANYMPSDRLRQRDRWGLSLRHDGSLRPLDSLPPLALSVNVNRVSDDNYWRDFSRSGNSLTQRLLPHDVSLGWNWEHFALRARRLTWQTLQDLTAPITPPYDRAPQLVGRYEHRELPGGFELMAEVDHTRFESLPGVTGQPNARRSYLLTQLSRPWQTPGWFVVPRLQLQQSWYDFAAPITTGATTARLSVPTFSLDGGLVFERDAEYFGRRFRQTLEPRAFYTYTPFRNQNFLPNYDSARNDFNFATIYTENAFGGHDRVSDNDLLTLGVTSRLIEPDSGAELARLGVAQRLRFQDQRVLLPGETQVSDRLSDILFGATLNWSPAWSTTGTIQYNPKSGESERATFSASWYPGSYRVVSAAYRRLRGQSEQLDVGWQWPLNDLWDGRGPARDAATAEGRWYSVGRLNFSLKDSRVVDSVLGIEYDAGCWVGRFVIERLQNGTSSSNKRVLFQLEFIGVSRLGSNALQALRENVPRYQFLREQVKAPSRFSNYE